MIDYVNIKLSKSAMDEFRAKYALETSVDCFRCSSYEYCLMQSEPVCEVAGYISSKLSNPMILRKPLGKTIDIYVIGSDVVDAKKTIMSTKESFYKKNR